LTTPASTQPPSVTLVRHAETEWSRSGRHTGHTDVPLTDSGRAAARALAPLLREDDFALVLVSPLGRAKETCALAGLGERAQATPDLLEWDYGDYEGLTTPEIRERRPGWNLWRDGCPGGEDAAAVGARVDRVIERALGVGGDVALFAHGHVLRVLAARWIELHPREGARLALSTGSLSLLGHERETRGILQWNRVVRVDAAAGVSDSDFG
jgi:probable phosphoglycerate mutase